MSSHAAIAEPPSFLRPWYLHWSLKPALAGWGRWVRGYRSWYGERWPDLGSRSRALPSYGHTYIFNEIEAERKWFLKLFGGSLSQRSSCTLMRFVVIDPVQNSVTGKYVPASAISIVYAAKCVRPQIKWPMHSSQCQQIHLENHFPSNSNCCNIQLRTKTIQSKQSELAQGSVSQGLIYDIYGERNIIVNLSQKTKRKQWWLKLLKLLATINPWNFSCLRKQQLGWPSIKA